MARRKKPEPTFSRGLCLVLSLVLLFVGTLGGAYLSILSNTRESDPLPAGNFSIHFPELGVAQTGDCTYIRAGENDILIDAGATDDSIPTITAFLDRYVTDGTLEYVIVTHAHEDHYAGFATNESTESLFDIYECETIIDFALTNQSPTARLYSNYVRERDAEIARGATHYTARECIEAGLHIIDLGSGMSLEILDSYYYYNTSSDENEYSVCTLLREGDRAYLFTGDLEKKGEEYLVEMNDLPEVELFKAGHHGSKTSSSEALLSVIRPKNVCVCCCAGSSQYTDTAANQFPTQEFINRVAPYTKNVYVTTLCLDWDSRRFTSMNGNLTVTVVGGRAVVTGSANSLRLFETDWFRDNRDTPAAWAA